MFIRRLRRSAGGPRTYKIFFLNITDGGGRDAGNNNNDDDGIFMNRVRGGGKDRGKDEGGKTGEYLLINRTVPAQ